jgi:alpha-galactosidase
MQFVAPTLELGSGALTVQINCRDDAPATISRFDVAGGLTIDLDAGLTAVEVLSPSDGHFSPVQRLSGTSLGARLRYVDHRSEHAGGVHQLLVDLATDDGVEARWRLTARVGVPAMTSQVTISNHRADDLVLIAAASLSLPVSGRVGGARVTTSGLDLFSGTSDWLAENRWSRRPLRDTVVNLSTQDYSYQQKAGHVARSFGTWSTARDLPIGVLAARDEPYALAWQIEHNGAWRWDITEDPQRTTLTLSGPTDWDHQWSEVLATGESFSTVPVTVSVGSGWEAAIAGLTAHRRAARRAHPDNRRQTLIYNDYMNTINGDPTTDKLLPLVDAAADAGAEVFCIDAGWYDDGHDWWPSVGAWVPSTTRFPNGLSEITDKIKSRGLVLGLWLEPEVVGVLSPKADELPAEAFFHRGGVRVVEAYRYHLDLRHPAARAHLDETVDRLVGELGVGMLKMDYNINPGPGTDLDAPSVGAGLLRHNRAVLAWIDGVLDRHPDLIIENCGSGAMRADYAMLSRLNLQSTSDQQDSGRYASIAAAAPMVMLPEQAGSWAYPAAAMSLEEIALTLQAGLLGRLYLSGYLNRLAPEQRALVHEAVAAHRALRPEILTGRPGWPLGLPGWEDEELALSLTGADSMLITLWHRDVGPARFDVPIPATATSVTAVFPTTLHGWTVELSGNRLAVSVDVAGPSARTFRLSFGPGALRQV